MSKIYFLSFGGPTQNYHEALNRIVIQATQLEIFDQIFSYTEENLKSDSEFWLKHSEFITNNPRGYGYWLWKPYLILKTLKNMNDSDILLYLDSGCEIDIKYKNIFNKLVENVKINKIIGTSTNSTDLTYTKMDLIKHIGLENNYNLLQKYHMQAGCILMEKYDIIVKLYTEIYEIASNYHMIDDSPSIEKNHNKFKEHRHDQSIFNLLVKKYNLHNYNLDELLTNNRLIIVARNRSGNTTL
jgi:hypothetical protein